MRIKIREKKEEIAVIFDVKMRYLVGPYEPIKVMYESQKSSRKMKKKSKRRKREKGFKVSRLMTTHPHLRLHLEEIYEQKGTGQEGSPWGICKGVHRAC